MPRRLGSFLLLVLWLCATGCNVAPWREQPPPWTESTLQGVADVRLVLREGAELVLASPRIDAVGAPATLLGTDSATGIVRCIALADVATLETRRTELLPLIVNIVIAAVLVTGLVVVCARGNHGRDVNWWRALEGVGGGRPKPSPTRAPPAPRRVRPSAEREEPDPSHGR